MKRIEIQLGTQTEQYHLQFKEILCQELDISSDLARDINNQAIRAGRRFDQVLPELGLIEVGELEKLKAQNFDFPAVTIEQLPGEPLNQDKIPTHYAMDHQIVLLENASKEVHLGMTDILDDFTANCVALKFGKPVKRFTLNTDQTENLRSFYQIKQSTSSGSDQVELDVQQLKDAASDAPVIKFVKNLIERAVQAGASDIHIKPGKPQTRILFRVAGTLDLFDSIAPHLAAPVISRLKIMAELDIAEQRLPQDSRIKTRVHGKQIDIRISTMPNIEGESAVLRLSTSEFGFSSLDHLGFSATIRDHLKRIPELPHGLILVTGPTGSGKTTTLYALLNQIIRPEVNVVTVEDPVEHKFSGISQIQVAPAIGLTFAKVLRSTLRQDPDVIMIGEIRDNDTAQIAVQAALTGHLVLATLHTNSATAAIPRLIDMGVEPFLLAETLKGILSQRLVKKLCANCKQLGSTGNLPKFLAAQISEDDEVWLRGNGCEICQQTGFTGRISIGEFLHINEEISNQISKGKLSLDAQQASQNHITLEHDALHACKSGSTTLNEILSHLNR